MGELAKSKLMSSKKFNKRMHVLTVSGTLTKQVGFLTVAKQANGPFRGQLSTLDENDQPCNYGDLISQDLYEHVFFLRNRRLI